MKEESTFIFTIFGDPEAIMISLSICHAIFIFASLCVTQIVIRAYSASQSTACSKSGGIMDAELCHRVDHGRQLSTEHRSFDDLDQFANGRDHPIHVGDIRIQ